MEQLSTPQGPPQPTPGGHGHDQLSSHDPSALLGMADNVGNENNLLGIEAPEIINPPTPEQVDHVLSDARSMMDELPVTRHTEQTRFDTVDVDEAILDDVTVKHLHGKDGDVTVIEPTSSEGGASQIVIDNNAEKIFIDGEPVDEAGADRVAGVITITRNMNAEASRAVSQHDAVQGQQEIEDTVSVDNVQDSEREAAEAKAMQQKRHITGQVGQVLATKNGNMAFRQLAEEMGADLGDLQEKIKTGDITIGEDTLRAMNEFQQDAAKPSSDIWNTDPRNTSMMGGVARESQQLLVNVLKSIL